MKEQALEIISLNDTSLFGLEENILAIGDRVLEVEGNKTVDQLDFHFYAASDRDILTHLRIKRKMGEIRDISLEAGVLRALELRFSPMTFQSCRNQCPFCFVDQMPKGLRPSLYFKDEDFRLGFLYGNYTTMNDITDSEIDKIITQKLQPQYVSVHAINREVRENVFGRPMRRDITATLKRLASSGIAIHAQIVLCPGINDGLCLEQTIETLESLDRNIRSLSVVPVGLTRHRENLPRIDRVQLSEYGKIIDLVEAYQRRFLEGSRKSRFVFLSDEWYVASGTPLPLYECYEDFPQIDNGVGMTRDFLSDIDKDLCTFGTPDKLGMAVIITGVLGGRVFSEYVLPLLASHNAGEAPHTVVIENSFFGREVTISGLLVFEDIAAALPEIGKGSVFFLPPNSLNYEGRFLDGLDLEHLRRSAGYPVATSDPSFVKSLHINLNGGGVNG